MMLRSSILLALALANALGASAADATDDQNAFNDSVQLKPPALPIPLPPLAFDVPLVAKPAGLGVVQDSFLGFSVEMSVANQVCALQLLCCHVSGLM
jgi:hypothetical protein